MLYGVVNGHRRVTTDVQALGSFGVIVCVLEPRFAAFGHKQFPRHRQMAVTIRPQEPDFFLSR